MSDHVGTFGACRVARVLSMGLASCIALAGITNIRETTTGVVATTIGFAVLFAGALQLRREHHRHARLQAGTEAMRKSEHRLRDFASMASDWFWEQDSELRFISIGVGPQTWVPRLIGKLRWEIADTSQDPDLWARHKRDLVERKPFREFRYSRVSPEGLVQYVSINGVPVNDDFGNFVGYRGTGRDITAEVEAEAALRAAKDRAEHAEALLHDAVDSISEGFVIYDREDRFVMCNEAYRRMFAKAAHLLVPGVLFEDILREVHARGGGSVDWHGREAEWYANRLTLHLEGKGAVENRAADGSWFLSTDRRMKNGGIAGLRINITELKRAQTALRESEVRLEQAQEIAGVGSWEMDVATGRFVWSRQLERIRGASPAEPTIEDIMDRTHPDDRPSVREWYAGLMAGHTQKARETRIVRPDGITRTIRVEGRGIAGPDGTICRLAGTVQDITEHRLLQRQLAHAQKMEAIGNLTGGIAHDFNNGLAIIIGNLDLLWRLVDADMAAKELCQEIREGALRCADLIRCLLAVARRQPLHPEPTDVNLLVENTARLLGRSLGDGIRLTLHLGATVRSAMTDPSQLEAALVNLATNARDAMPRGGHLNIMTGMVELDASYVMRYPDASPGEYVLIKVTDTGTGIAPEIIGRIFEPFFTTKQPTKGTGLGLSMVFGFARQSGGHLAVASEAGHGSEFSIYLPCAPVGGKPAAKSSHAASPMRGDATVLLVEDNPQLRNVTARQLIALGYRVREAEDADAALAIISGGEPFHLLFTDVTMPGTMDGLDLAERAAELRQDVKILLMSGFPGIRDADNRMASLRFPLINKPFGQDELAWAVYQALNAHEDQPGGETGQASDRQITQPPGVISVS